MLNNAEIADRLASLAQLLSTQEENPYKVRAYQRAAQRIRTFPKAWTNSRATKPISRASRESATPLPAPSAKSFSPAP